MSKTISEEKYNATVAFIKSTVEPKLNKMVSAINEYLKNRGVRVGVEFTWFIDEIKDSDNEK